MLRIGFFPKFKDADSILIDADTDGIRLLLELVSAAAANPQTKVPIHDRAIVSVKNPALLFVSGDCRMARAGSKNTYFLDVSGSAKLQIEGLLETLTASTAGHQYFDLWPDSCDLIVSVGEYGAAWWERHETV